MNGGPLALLRALGFREAQRGASKSRPKNQKLTEMTVVVGSSSRSGILNPFLKDRRLKDDGGVWDLVFPSPTLCLKTHMGSNRFSDQNQWPPSIALGWIDVINLGLSWPKHGGSLPAGAEFRFGDSEKYQ